MKIADIISSYEPESWGRNEDWDRHALRLWAEEGEYMAALLRRMLIVGWPNGPVVIDDNVVQDGHHRIVIERYMPRSINIPVQAVLQSAEALVLRDGAPAGRDELLGPTGDGWDRSTA